MMSKVQMPGAPGPTLDPRGKVAGGVFTISSIKNYIFGRATPKTSSNKIELVEIIICEIKFFSNHPKICTFENAFFNGPIQLIKFRGSQRVRSHKLPKR